MRFPFPFFDVITIPSDAGPGDPRIVINGPAGTIEFYDANDDLVGLLSPSEWYTGILGQARAQMDPFGGFRVFDANGDLAGIFSSLGLQTLEPLGDATSTLSPAQLSLASDDGMVEVGVLSGQPFAPMMSQTTSLTPGTTITTPLYPGPAISDGVDVRHVAAYDDTGIVGTTWTPPGGYSEISDTSDGVGEGTLSTSIATRDTATGGVHTFTSSSGAWDMDVGTTVMVRGLGGTAAYRSISIGAITRTLLTSHSISLGPPAGTAANDVLLAFVSFGCDGVDATGAGVPTAWSVPSGWKFLGASFNTTGVGASAITIAVGVWYKIATASEPASYNVNITVPGNGEKKFQPIIVAVQGADTQAAGPDIQIDNRSIGRGLVQDGIFTATTSDVARAAGANTDATITSVFNTGRRYRVSVLSQFTGSVAGAIYALDLEEDGVVQGRIGRADLEAGSTTGFFDSSFLYTPTSTGTHTLNLQNNAGSGGTLQLIAGGGQPRQFWVEDIGTP